MLNSIRVLFTSAADLYAHAIKTCLEGTFGEVIVFRPKGRRHFEAFFRHPVYEVDQRGTGFEGKQVIAQGKSENGALLALFHRCALPPSGSQIWAYREADRERENLHTYDVIGFSNGNFIKINERLAANAPSFIAGKPERIETIPAFFLRSID
jgi:pimeloyl-ACP methyl ester carboxylesterase